MEPTPRRALETRVRRYRDACAHPPWLLAAPAGTGDRRLYRGAAILPRLCAELSDQVPRGGAAPADRRRHPRAGPIPRADRATSASPGIQWLAASGSISRLHVVVVDDDVVTLVGLLQAQLELRGLRIELFGR